LFYTRKKAMFLKIDVIKMEYKKCLEDIFRGPKLRLTDENDTRHHSTDEGIASVIKGAR
jgi:hypothetical protein